MKKITVILFALIAFSCSDSDSPEEEIITGISDNSVSGKLYGANFALNGGKGFLTNVVGVDSYELYFTSQDLGCETTEFSGFPITLTAPREIGTHTTNVYLKFRDPNSSDFVNTSSGITVEIISNSNNLIVGKVRGAAVTTDNSIEGRFEIPICQ